MPRRNEKCFCGSGKRFKHCHGAFSANRRHEPIANWHEVPQRVRNAFNRKAVEEAKHYTERGFARLPLIAGSDGNRFIIRGKEILHYTGPGTFFNFLESDLHRNLGEAFRENADHPLHAWWKAVRAQAKAADSLYSTSAVLNYFTVAHDLFIIADNADARERLLKSLRIPQQFHGARYELLVGASLIRAGFSFEFVDEDDLTQRHSDAHAIHRRTGNAYSVEMKAKGRPGTLGKPGTAESLETMKRDVSRLLRDALAKPAQHERLVFIDMNLPPSAVPLEGNGVWWQDDAVSSLRAVEQKMGKLSHTTSGFVIFTNSPAHHTPHDEYPYGIEKAFTAFNKPGFADGLPFLHEAYPDIADLFHALEMHDIIPDHFNGGKMPAILSA